MSFNGSGIYTVPSTTVTPAVVDTIIDQLGFNTFTADMAAAFNLCVLNDGQTVKPIINSPIINEILDANQNEVLVLGTTASAVNAVKITDAATGAAPIISATGESNIGARIDDSNGNRLMTFGVTASAVNYIGMTNKATGVAPELKSRGEADTGLVLKDSNGNELLQMDATASAVNNLVIANAATGNAAALSTSETNTDLSLAGNGTGGVTIAQDKLKIGATAVTSTAAELNIMDGVTSTAAELNILDGVTSTAAELNILDGVTSTAAELNILDGVTSTAAEINNLQQVAQETVQATTSGTTKDFTVPSWAKKITVSFDQVSTSSAGFALFIRIGTSSTVDTTGYESTASIISASAATLTASTLAFFMCDLVPAAEYVSGVATLVNTTGNVWEITGTAHNPAAGAANRQFSFAGRKSISGTIDIVQLGSGGTFDNGQVNAIYEG